MNSEKFFNHIISACVNIGLPVNRGRGVNIGLPVNRGRGVNIGLPVNRGRGVNIGCDMFLAICKPRHWNWNWNWN